MLVEAENELRRYLKMYWKESNNSQVSSIPNRPWIGPTHLSFYVIMERAE